MINEERKEALTGFLSGSRYTSLSEVFAAFPDISQSTIRRDLQSLASEGKVILLRGGVKLPGIKEVHDLPIKSKLMINTEAKKRMSYAAARMVRDGDVIYLDSSSSVYPLLRFLTAKDVTVVTTGIYTAVLAVSLGFRCETVGGEIRNSVGSVVGSVTEEELRQRHFSIAFMSSNGFSADTGISTPHAEEAAKIRIVRANSEKKPVPDGLRQNGAEFQPCRRSGAGGGYNLRQRVRLCGMLCVVHCRGRASGKARER